MKLQNKDILKVEEAREKYPVGTVLDCPTYWVRGYRVVGHGYMPTARDYGVVLLLRSTKDSGHLYPCYVNELPEPLPKYKEVTFAIDTHYNSRRIYLKGQGKSGKADFSVEIDGRPAVHAVLSREQLCQLRDMFQDMIEWTYDPKDVA